MIFLSQLITGEVRKFLINKPSHKKSACLRSKRSEVRILSGVPLFKYLRTLPGSIPPIRTLAQGFFCTGCVPDEELDGRLQ